MSPPPPLATCLSVPSSTIQPFAGNSDFPIARHPAVVFPSNKSFHPADCSSAVSVFGPAAKVVEASAERASRKERMRALDNASVGRLQQENGACDLRL